MARVRVAIPATICAALVALLAIRLNDSGKQEAPHRPEDLGTEGPGEPDSPGTGIAGEAPVVDAVTARNEKPALAEFRRLLAAARRDGPDTGDVEGLIASLLEQLGESPVAAGHLIPSLPALWKSDPDGARALAAAMARLGEESVAVSLLDLLGHGVPPRLSKTIAYSVAGAFSVRSSAGGKRIIAPDDIRLVAEGKVSSEAVIEGLLSAARRCFDAKGPLPDPSLSDLVALLCLNGDHPGVSATLEERCRRTESQLELSAIMANLNLMDRGSSDRLIHQIQNRSDLSSGSIAPSLLRARAMRGSEQDVKLLIQGAQGRGGMFTSEDCIHAMLYIPRRHTSTDLRERLLEVLGEVVDKRSEANEVDKACEVVTRLAGWAPIDWPSLDSALRCLTDPKSPVSARRRTYLLGRLRSARGKCPPKTAEHLRWFLAADGSPDDHRRSGVQLAKVWFRVGEFEQLIKDLLKNTKNEKFRSFLKNEI